MLLSEITSPDLVSKFTFPRGKLAACSFPQVPFLDPQSSVRQNSLCSQTALQSKLKAPGLNNRLVYFGVQRCFVELFSKLEVDPDVV